MSSRKNEGLLGLLLFGAVMFGVGRCSVATPPVPTKQPSALLAPVQADVVESPAPAEGAAAEATDIVEQDRPRTSPAAVLSGGTDDPESLTSDSASESCGSKRFCREMNSCGEAMHYLNDCGVGRLDGDGDGVPCESIC